jgi:hypothetical protein
MNVAQVFYRGHEYIIVGLSFKERTDITGMMIGKDLTKAKPKASAKRRRPYYLYCYDLS